jgi:peptide/nickel transport system permease protein
MTATTNTVSAGWPARVWKSFGPILSQPRSAIGLIIVLLAIVSAVGAPILAPYDPNQPDFLSILAPPSAAHWLGTDDLGRDVLSRIIYGSQASLMVGALSVVGALVVGTLITAVLGPSLPNAILAIAIVNLPVFARIARAQTLVLRRQEFVEAKRSLGFGTPNILLTTILPNSMAPLVVQGSLLFASAIITESYLSFLGLGVQPPAATWGNMLRSALGFMDIAPWLAWFPGVAIFITVLGFNLLGDGLRDQFDPRG